MSEFVFDKIIRIGDIQGLTGSQYAIIKAVDYPVSTISRRTTYWPSLEITERYATTGIFPYSKKVECRGIDTGSSTAFVGMELNILKEIRPHWCITKKDLLAQYEAMQREDDSGPIWRLDLRKEPELLKMAKHLWAEKLDSLRKKS